MGACVRWPCWGKVSQGVCGRMTLLRKTLRLATISMLTVCLYLLGCQSRMIYFPRAYEAADLAELAGHGGVRLAFATNQGNQTAFYLPPDESGEPGSLPRRIWLCFGGNGALALEWLALRDSWPGEDAFLLIDYPGYGLCEGSPSPATITQSIRGAVDAMEKHLNTDADTARPRLAVLGHSIGCAAALIAANELKVNHAVLVSPFTSMTEMGRRMFGRPLCLLNRHRFDNRRQLQAMLERPQARITLFHGLDDEIIPIGMSRELAGLDKTRIQFHEVKDAGHNDILWIARQGISKAMR